MLELMVVIVILGILAAIFVPRYMGMTEEAGKQAGRAALAEGFNQFKLAYTKYTLSSKGSAPKSLADLAPDYMNATTVLGDYTVVLVQAGTGGDLTLNIYGAAGVGGTPLVTSTVPWP
jgi:Tfp pilus assembly protein PilE